MLLRRTCNALLGAAFCALLAMSAQAKDMQLTAAISPDIPPYVEEGATGGLEVDVVRQSLEGYEVDFVQVPFDKIQNAIQRGVAEVAISVRPDDSAVYYSKVFIGFANVAITKKSDRLTIDKVDDLAGHRVYSWQGAYLELGDAFKMLFEPGAPHHGDYVEMANQTEEAQTFWNEAGAVIVIDRAVFAHLSAGLGHSMDEAEVHQIFPPTSEFHVGFKDSEVRDAFDAGLEKLCTSGGYAELLDHYGIILLKSPCDI